MPRRTTSSTSWKASGRRGCRGDAAGLQAGIDVAAIGPGRQASDPGGHAGGVQRGGMGEFHALAEAGIEGAVAEAREAVEAGRSYLALDGGELEGQRARGEGEAGQGGGLVALDVDLDQRRPAMRRG